MKVRISMFSYNGKFFPYSQVICQSSLISNIFHMPNCWLFFSGTAYWLIPKSIQCYLQSHLLTPSNKEKGDLLSLAYNCEYQFHSKTSCKLTLHSFMTICFYPDTSMPFKVHLIVFLLRMFAQLAFKTDNFLEQRK